MSWSAGNFKISYTRASDLAKNEAKSVQDAESEPGFRSEAIRYLRLATFVRLTNPVGVWPASDGHDLG